MIAYLSEIIGSDDCLTKAQIVSVRNRRGVDP